jgi:hypothetical protein
VRTPDVRCRYHAALWPALLELQPRRVGVLAVGFPTELSHVPLKGEMVIEGPVCTTRGGSNP